MARALSIRYYELLVQRRTPASLPQPFQPGILKRRKDFVHLMIASHHRAVRQDHTVIKSFTHHVTQHSFNFHIPRPLIHLILIVIKDE